MQRGWRTGRRVVVVRRSGKKIGYGVSVVSQDTEVMYVARDGMIATVSNVLEMRAWERS